MSLTPLDLSLFTHGSPAERKRLASALCRDLAQTGFVKLVNHGVEDAMVEELFDWVRCPFDRCGKKVHAEWLPATHRTRNSSIYLTKQSKGWPTYQARVLREDGAALAQRTHRSCTESNSAATMRRKKVTHG